MGRGGSVGERFQGSLRRGIPHLGEQQVAALAFDQGANRAAVAGALDQVALPVPRHLPRRDFDRTLMDRGPIGQDAASIRPACTRPAALMGLGQRRDQFFVRKAPRGRA